MVQIKLLQNLGDFMSDWVLILGGSTGHGAAVAKKLALEGFGIISFHLDRGEAKKIAQKNIEEINELTNGKCHYFNTNAASEDVMNDYNPKIKEITSSKPLKLILHSIAFGTTTNFFGEKPVTERQMNMTIHVMSNSLLYWTQKLFIENFLTTCLIGVYPEEKKNKQKVKISITLKINRNNNSSDNINSTVCYQKILTILNQITNYTHINLVETLPNVSIPSDNGVTSRSKISSTSPANTPP